MRCSESVSGLCIWRRIYMGLDIRVLAFISAGEAQGLEADEALVYWRLEDVAQYG